MKARIMAAATTINPAISSMPVKENGVVRIGTKLFFPAILQKNP